MGSFCFCDVRFRCLVHLGIDFVDILCSSILQLIYTHIRLMSQTWLTLTYDKFTIRDH